MKEIKFNAWDKLDKKIYPVHSIIFNDEHEVRRIFVLKEENGAVYLHDISTPYFILLPYTGLTDKNRNEIYENDIVRCDGYLWKIVWMEDEACFGLEGIYDNLIATFDNYRSDECEVLGNIYENIELLEE